jgi:hypothetical protein
MIKTKNNDEKSTSFKGQLNSDYVYLFFTARLITFCEPLLGYIKKLTHYNKFAVKQHELSIGVAKGWGNQINVTFLALNVRVPVLQFAQSLLPVFFCITLGTDYSYSFKINLS